MDAPLQLTAADGRTLAATIFEPTSEARGTVVLLPAWAVRRRYYSRFARFVAEAGFRVLTFDPRGIGESRVGHIRHETVTTSEWAQLDHQAALDWLAEQPGPRLAVAHSFGGQILGIIDAPGRLDGLYCVASQLGYWGHWDGFARLRMRILFSMVMPTTTRLFGYLPGWTGIGEDVPQNALLEWATWLQSPGYLLDHVEGASERFLRVEAPVAVVGFTDDTYAPPRGVRAFADCLPPASTTTRILDPADVQQANVGHFGFFRSHPHDAMWRDALEHLERWAQQGIHTASARGG